LFVIVALTVHLADVTQTAVRVRRTDHLAIWPAVEVVPNLVWRPEGDGATLVVKM
jgi:hypothetical protein